MKDAEIRKQLLTNGNVKAPVVFFPRLGKTERKKQQQKQTKQEKKQ